MTSPLGQSDADGRRNVMLRGASAEEPGEPLISLTMTREAAEKFLRALGYSAAVVESAAEANHAPETRMKMAEHADWLRWGYSRLGALTGRWDG